MMQVVYVSFIVHIALHLTSSFKVAGTTISPRGYEIESGNRNEEHFYRRHFITDEVGGQRDLELTEGGFRREFDLDVTDDRDLEVHADTQLLPTYYRHIRKTNFYPRSFSWRPTFVETWHKNKFFIPVWKQVWRPKSYQSWKAKQLVLLKNAKKYIVLRRVPLRFSHRDSTY